MGLVKRESHYRPYGRAKLLASKLKQSQEQIYRECTNCCSIGIYKLKNNAFFNFDFCKRDKNAIIAGLQWPTLLLTDDCPRRQR